MRIQLTASTTAGQASSNQKDVEEELTVGKVLDARIKHAREHLEALVIQKAKADTAGLLEFPQSVINGLAW